MLKKSWNVQRKLPQNLLISIIILIFLVSSLFLIFLIEVPAFNNTKNEIFEEMAYAHHISIAPDSNNIVVGTGNGFVKLYNYTSSKKLRIIDFKDTEAFAGSIDDVKWSPDGNQFAVRGGLNFRRGGESRDYIRVYSKTGDLIMENQIDFSVIESNIDWSLDSNKIVYGSGLNLIIWDIEEDMETTYTHLPYDAENRNNAILSIAWSFDDNLIAYVDHYGNTAVIINATNGNEIDRLYGYARVITWKPNEYNLYLITDYLSDITFDKEIRMWNYTNGVVTTLQSDNGLDLKDIQSLEFSPDGTKILIRSITSNNDIGFSVIDSSTFQIIYDDYSVAGSSYSWSVDGNLIMAGAQDGSVHVWAGNTGSYQKSLPVLDFIQWFFILLSIGIIVLFIISIYFKKCFGSIPILFGTILMLNGLIIEAGDTTLRKDLYLSIFLVGLFLFIWGYLTFILYNRPFSSTINNKKIHSHIWGIQSIFLVLFAIYLAYFQFFGGNIWDLFNDRNPLNYSNFYQWGTVLLLLGLIWPILILIKLQANNIIEKEAKVNAIKRSAMILTVGLPIFLFFSFLFLEYNRVYVIIPFCIAFLLIPTLSTTVYNVLTQIGKKDNEKLDIPDYCIRLYLIVNQSVFLIWGALTIFLILITPGT